MRAQRMKNVVLVEDFIGTGRRMGSYLRDVMDSTLKSWISYKWTKLWIVCYGGLEAGVRNVLHKGYGLDDDGCGSRRWPSGRVNFFPPHGEILQEIRGTDVALAMPYGFGNGAVGMIFEHSCPNNAPVVLWSEGPKFTPLFPKQGIPWI